MDLEENTIQPTAHSKVYLVCQLLEVTISSSTKVKSLHGSFLQQTVLTTKGNRCLQAEDSASLLYFILKGASFYSLAKLKETHRFRRQTYGCQGEGIVRDFGKVFPSVSAGKESACNAGDLGSIPGLGRSPGEGKGYLLQYSGLENSMESDMTFTMGVSYTNCFI